MKIYWKSIGKSIVNPAGIRPASGRNPAGIRPESGRNLTGFQPKSNRESGQILAGFRTDSIGIPAGFRLDFRPYGVLWGPKEPYGAPGAGGARSPAYGPWILDILWANYNSLCSLLLAM